jgi:hypothetical protein
MVVLSIFSGKNDMSRNNSRILAEQLLNISYIGNPKFSTQAFMTPACCEIGNWLEKGHNLSGLLFLPEISRFINNSLTM